MTTPADMIKKYVEIRDYIKDCARNEEIRIAPYKKALEVLENALLSILNEEELQNIKSKYGTAFKDPIMSVEVTNPEALFDYVMKTRKTALLTAAVCKSEVKTFLKENGGKPPPGVRVSEFVKIKVRRPS